MKKIVPVFFVLLLMQCNENEFESIILPSLSTVSVLQEDSDEWDFTVEFTGEFVEGQSPIKNVKIVWTTNHVFSSNPTTFPNSKTVELLSANTFKVNIDVFLFRHNLVAFSFDSGSTVTYSQTYEYDPFSNSLTPYLSY